jgi:hypothetical protein
MRGGYDTRVGGADSDTNCAGKKMTIKTTQTDFNDFKNGFFIAELVVTAFENFSKQEKLRNSRQW